MCGKVELTVHHLQQRNGRISTSHTVTPSLTNPLSRPAKSRPIPGGPQAVVYKYTYYWFTLTLPYTDPPALSRSLDYDADSVCSTAAPAWPWHRCRAQRTLGTSGILSLCAHPKQHGPVPGSGLQQHADAQLAGTRISSWSGAAEHELAAAPRPRVPPARPHLPVLALRSCLPWEVRLPYNRLTLRDQLWLVFSIT